MYHRIFTLFLTYFLACSTYADFKIEVDYIDKETTKTNHDYLAFCQDLNDSIAKMTGRLVKENWKKNGRITGCIKNQREQDQLIAKNPTAYLFCQLESIQVNLKVLEKLFTKENNWPQDFDLTALTSLTHSVDITYCINFFNNNDKPWNINPYMSE